MRTEALRPAAPLSGCPPLCGQGGVRLHYAAPASSPGAGASIPVYRPGNPGVPGLLILPQATCLLCDSTESWSPAPSRPSLGWGPRSAAALFPVLPEGPGLGLEKVSSPLAALPCSGLLEGAAQSWGSWRRTGGQVSQHVGAGRQPCSAHLQEKGRDNAVGRSRHCRLRDLGQAPSPL